MRAIIFANGELRSQEHIIELSEDDLIIAANGGSRHCLDLGIIPNILIGDLDSMDRNQLAEWRDIGVKVIEFPEDKDQTDLELAMLYAQRGHPAEILVYGGIGGRLDMTMANLFLLAHPDIKTPTTFICAKEKVRLLKAGDTLHISGDPGDTRIKNFALGNKSESKNGKDKSEQGGSNVFPSIAISGCIRRSFSRGLCAHYTSTGIFGRNR